MKGTLRLLRLPPNSGNNACEPSDNNNNSSVQHSSTAIKTTACCFRKKKKSGNTLRMNFGGESQDAALKKKNASERNRKEVGDASF